MSKHDQLAKVVGERFGRLTVLSLHRDTESKPWAFCRCDCGTEKEIRADHLLSGASKSCGCLNKEAARQRELKHGESGTRLFRTWTHVKGRCENPTDRAYAGYGGRGIAVCEEWASSYAAFRDWALNNGYSSDLTLDRIDNDGDYSPDNCRWVSRLRQANNRRSTVWIEAFGERKSTADWAHDPRCVVGYQTLVDRLERGMAPELAIATPHMRPHDYRLGKVGT